MRSGHPIRKSRRGGFFAADAIVGLIVVAILAVTLTVAVNHQRRATDRLADTRDAVRLAEETLTALQNGMPIPAPPVGIEVSLRRDGSATAPKGCAWAVVAVTRAGRTVELSGIVLSVSLGAAAGGSQ